MSHRSGAVKKFMKSSGFAALAAGIAMAVLPVAAQAQDGGGSHRWREGRGGGEKSEARQEHRQERRSENRGSWERRAEPAAQSAPAPRVRSEGGGNRTWGTRGDGAHRSGRDWNNDGEARRQVQVEPTARGTRYADPDRNRTYDRRDGRPSGEVRTQGWDGQRWTGQNWDRNRDGRPDVRRDHDGRHWDGNRDGRRDWSRDWRRDRRYDWQSWRSSNRHAFHIGHYYAPYRHYRYRRLSIGFHLDHLFFSSRYWINDPYQYRLPPAYGPYRWVRYYDDALLVNIYNGRVVDVIYDFFW